jgi:uridine phosphorylase
MPHVYHLDLDEARIEGARFALLPGDPFRSRIIAERIAELYGAPRPAGPLAHRREYCTYLSDIEGTRVLVTSTGIGGPSTAIAVDELAQLGVETLIRVGTTGAIQDAMAVGDVVVTTGAVRLDGASTHYAPIEYPAVAHPEVLVALMEAAAALAAPLGCRYHVGITASTDTFYQAQERGDGRARYVPRALRGMTEDWQRLHVLNYEMEAATLLTLGSALGLRAGCVTGVINTRATDARAEPITAAGLRLGEEHALRVGIRAMEMLAGDRLPPHLRLPRRGRPGAPG